MVIHSKLRSWLTIIGIVIGVGSVIAIVALGEGMRPSVNSRLGGLGADLLTLTAGAARGFGGMGGGGSSNVGATASDEIPQLDRGDVQVLKGIPEIFALDTQISGRVDIAFLSKKGSVSLTGVDQKEWYKITTEEIRDGRLLGPADQNVVVIGARLADTYFDSPLGVNKMFTIEGRSFRIVGVLDDQSTSIYMPIQMAYQVLEDKDQDVYDSIIIKAKSEELVPAVEEKVTKKLLISRHKTERNKDFSIRTQQQAAARFAEITGAITLFLTAIAAVSLLVGAVGIANTMFTSVLEKTKDIGIMKAIGARNSDILKIFLINAGLIGLIGGIIGVFLGIVLSKLMPFVVPNMRGMGGQAIVTTSSMLVALLVALLVGMLAGVIPAYKASRLKPVDALRYE